MSNKKNMGAAVASDNNESGKLPLSFKITAITLASVMLVMIVIGLVFALSNIRVTIDFIDDDLSKYVSISKDDYHGFEVQSIARQPGELEIQDAINQLLYQHRKEKEGDSGFSRNIDVKVGDTVNLYYRGYYEEGGKKIYFDNGCNFNKTYEPVGIGSGALFTGFEYNLIGENQKDHATLTKISDKGATVMPADTVLITYSVTRTDGTSANSASAIVDLSDVNLDETWGDGFYAYWRENNVTVGNSFSALLKDNTMYTNVTVSEVYRINANKESYGKEILEVDAYVPYDHTSEELRGRDVKFEIFIVSIQEFDTPEYNEEFITEKLKLSENDLTQYKGDNLVEKHTNSIKAQLEEEYEAAVEEEIAATFWEHIMEVAEFKKLPKGDVEEYYDALYANIQSAYTQYQDSYTFNDFVYAYMGITSDKKWEDVLYTEAENAIKQKLCFYYVIRQEGFVPSEEEFNKLKEEAFNTELQYYLDYYKITESTANYASLVEEAKQEILSSYAEEYWETQVYYDYGLDKICGLATVKKK